MNKLFYGDNLDILRNYIQDESVVLVYLDPPFNSNANYNVLFSQQNGSQSSAQIDMPLIRQANQTYRRASRYKGDEGKQLELLEE